MSKLNNLLLAGGIISAQTSIYHIILALIPALFRFTAPDHTPPTLQMTEHGSSISTTASISLVAFLPSGQGTRVQAQVSSVVCLC